MSKLLIKLCRALGYAGSNLPGRVALFLYPRILARLSGQCRSGAVLVTGTNGKTTTALMLTGILNRAGLTVVHNRSGANLISGITATYLQACDWRGRMKAAIGVAEVDEASVARVVREMPVRAIVVTNFFRDQLDRFGELDHTVTLVGRGLELLGDKAWALLNADDPLVAGLAGARRGPITFYGVEADADPGEHHPAREIRYCSRCELPFRYLAVTYGHLGHYRCPGCGDGRPVPDIAVTGIWQGGAGAGSLLAVRTGRGPVELAVPLPGMYNVYNALAAVACSDALDLPWQAVEEGLAAFTASFGRMERLAVDGREVLLILVKNPAGFNEVIRILLRDGDCADVLIAINNKYADGTDVSWLWDVDFERLVAGARLDRVTVAGTRAEAMAVRLKYAGLDRGVTMCSDLGDALRVALQGPGPGGRLYVLPTYTAMLGLRDAIRRLGYARRYWEA
ncbi:MAG: Mur ligase family protein [bacterium]|nr:Mur ligase family protein [bacterium]